MDDELTLIGFRHSVYTRIVRMALIELGLDAAYVEVDPFADVIDPSLTQHTPFGRVPVLRHGAFTLTETAAITGYLNDLADGPNLRANTAQATARMTQVIGIIDAYGYQPMVRDVFSHGFYRPQMNEEFDAERVPLGLLKARAILQALDAIAQEGVQLSGKRISLADIHLAPMMDCFTKVGEAADLLSGFPALAHWWEQMNARPSLIATDPFGA